MKKEGYGEGYRYAHDETEGFAAGETYLPEPLEGSVFYEPTERGYEKMIGERMRWLRGKKPGDE
jgi:putative ATPase